MYINTFGFFLLFTDLSGKDLYSDSRLKVPSAFMALLCRNTYNLWWINLKSW